MPRYYCDYCDTYLTHDSPSVRKQHNAGYKHKANVRSYYQQFEEQQTQSLIDQRIREHLHSAPQGAGMPPHLAASRGNLPLGAAAAVAAAAGRPPVLPIPGQGFPAPGPPLMRPPGGPGGLGGPPQHMRMSANGSGSMLPGPPRGPYGGPPQDNRGPPQRPPYGGPMGPPGGGYPRPGGQPYPNQPYSNLPAPPPRGPR